MEKCPPTLHQVSHRKDQGAPSADDGAELDTAVPDNEGSETEGTTVVPTTLARGSARSASGVTTGFERGGEVTTGRPDGRPDGATRTADGTGVNSIGG